MNMLEQLARLVLPKEILDNFDIVKIETDESDIDAMSMTIHLDERMNAYLQKSEDYESKGFMDAVRITDFGSADLVTETTSFVSLFTFFIPARHFASA